MLARLVVDLAADVDDLVAGHGLDGLDGRGDGEPVARADGADVGELLVAVHHSAVVQAEPRVRHDVSRRLEGDGEHKSGRGDHIGMAEGLGGLGIRVHGVGVTHRHRELANLLPADLIGLGGRIGPPHEGLVERHGLGTS